jgi:RNA polymerase sigma-70 factor, ECF subfamily
MKTIYLEAAMPHMDLLYNYALLLCSDHDEAAGLLEDVYLSGYNSVGHALAGNDPKVWLLRQMYERRIGIGHGTTEIPGNRNGEHNGSDAGGIAEAYGLAGEFIDEPDIQNAIRRLAVDLKTVLYLHDNEGMDRRAIAKTIGVAADDIAALLHRARNELGHLLFCRQEFSTTGI